MSILDKLRKGNTERCPLFGLGEIKDVSLEFKAIELAGETGELMNAIKKYLRGDKTSHDKGVEIKIEQQIEDELADVIICCDLLAAKFDIDLTKAVKNKFNKTSTQRGYNVFIDDVRRRKYPIIKLR